MARMVADKNTKREKILAAASSVFSKKGYHGAKMEEIATEAGISKGGIYLYFKSKEDLFFKLMESHLEDFRAVCGRELSSTKSPPDKLRSLITVFCRRFDEWEELQYLVADFWGEMSRQQDREYSITRGAELNREVTNLFSFFFKEGVEKGYYREDLHAEDMATIVHACLDGLMIQWVLDREGVPVDRLAEHLTETILRGIEK